MVKVSIVVPVYNVEKYLQECLDSLVGQTLEDIEIIAVNDGSQDKSLQILEEYAAKDSRIHIISQPHRGVSTARNAALKIACGEYIQFIDSDDFIKPDCCQKIYTQAAKSDCDILMFSGYTYFDNNHQNNLSTHSFLHNHLGKISAETISFSTFTEITKLLCDKLYKKKFIGSISFPSDVKICEDGLFNIALLSQKPNIYLSDEQLYYYRQNNHTSATSNPLYVVKEMYFAFNHLFSAPYYTNTDESFKLYCVEKMLESLLWHFNRAAGLTRLRCTKSLIAVRRLVIANVSVSALQKMPSFRNMQKISLFRQLGPHIWKKIKQKRGETKIKQCTFLGIPFFKKEKSPSKIKYNICGIKFCRHQNKKDKTSSNNIVYNQDFEQYGKWLKDLKENRSLFVPLTSKPYQRKEDDIKIFAYYLTQFHSIPENDEAHGKGFTEWNNVATTVPAFVGHYQPIIPYDLGFYNLLTPGIMERQAEIAKTYGIYGFCFYYYWFNGKKVLEKPLEYFLKSNIDLHFHFFWANETWTSRWQGGNKEIILEQKYDKEKFEQFFYDMLPYLKDDRYEKIDNKPVLIIYHPDDFIDKSLYHSFVETINRLAIDNGFNGMYLTTLFDFKKDKNYLKEHQLDGLTEFFPCGLTQKLKEKPTTAISPDMKIHVWNMHDYISETAEDVSYDYDLYKCCCPSWDNSARKLYSSADLYHLEDNDFKIWLRNNINWIKKHNAPNKQYLYINAWNEWGEGAILEPTTRYGYKNLQTIKEVLESFQLDKK